MSALGAIIQREMITVPSRWRRYCGPRSELVRATELAADVLQESTGVRSKVEVELGDRRGVTETTSSVDALTTRHPAELADLESIAITVEPDRGAWWDKHYDGKVGTASVPEIPAGPVRIRVSQHGVTLAVSGEDPTRVKGLSRQLTDALDRAATHSPGFPREVLIVFGSAFAAVGFSLGLVVVRWLDLAEKNDRWDAAEIIGLIGGAVVGIAVAAGLWWIFPPVEIFDEGGAGRARRFRKWILTAVGALILGILATFIYDQAS